MVRTKGFDSVDVLYIDSLSQSFWLDVVNYRKAVYRVADYNPHFEKYTPAMRTLEKEMARRADLVVYPSQNLKNYVSDLGARRSYCLPNGVDFEHFATPMVAPAEYEALPGPVAVYVGVMPYWFHFDWLRQAARVLPEVSFVLIGPDDLAKYEFNGIANIHLLGLKNYATLPAFLQHANVGLMPFDLAKNPAGVNVLNPQKLYSYLASGLPVVSADWEEIRTVNSPAILCASAEQFIKGIRQALSDPGDPKSLRRYASKFDWNQRVPELLSVLARTDKACA
jgi:glycosyltransferase involved in cell wall biosynthesis